MAECHDSSKSEKCERGGACYNSAPQTPQNVTELGQNTSSDPRMEEQEGNDRINANQTTKVSKESKHSTSKYNNNNYDGKGEYNTRVKRPTQHDCIQKEQGWSKSVDYDGESEIREPEGTTKSLYSDVTKSKSRQESHNSQRTKPQSTKVRLMNLSCSCM